MVYRKAPGPFFAKRVLTPFLAEAHARIEARGFAQLLVEGLFALGERARNGDVEECIEIARAAGGLGQPLAGEAQLLPCARAGWHLHGDAPVKRRHFDLCAERRLPWGDRHLD